MKKNLLVILMTIFVCVHTALAEVPQGTEKEAGMNALTEQDKEAIVKKVNDRFIQLVAAINTKDIAAWETLFSKDEFESGVAGATFFATRSDWVKAITSNFSMRESQHVEIKHVNILPLNPETALLTSQEHVAMKLKNGEAAEYSHVYTMIWKKGPEGWQIIHSHESWVEEQAKPEQC